MNKNKNKGERPRFNVKPITQPRIIKEPGFNFSGFFFILIIFLLVLIINYLSCQ